MPDTEPHLKLSAGPDYPNTSRPQPIGPRIFKGTVLRKVKNVVHFVQSWLLHSAGITHKDIQPCAFQVVQACGHRHIHHIQNLVSFLCGPISFLTR